jgi:hypothetical protein
MCDAQDILDGQPRKRHNDIVRRARSLGKGGSGHLLALRT